MDLHGKFFVRAQQLDQEGKARALRDLAEDFGAARYPEIVQAAAFLWALAHDALRFRPIDDLPGLADFYTRRQFLSVKRLEPSSAPDALLKDGVEEERAREVGGA